MNYRKIRAIISGGGTGGHIFPAISIAGKLREVNPENEILFVGAEGKMEMEKVPQAGYRIVGLPIVGLQRQLNWKNIKNDAQIPAKLIESARKAGKVIKDFKPDIVIGVGGYASAPLLWKAMRNGIPTLIQEQNGFAGLTNKILSKKAGKICVAYEGMEKFFPPEKIVLTGNPIRREMHPFNEEEVKEGLEFYGFTPGKKHLLIVGGSLGSRTLNEAVKAWIDAGLPGGADVEVLWQCGKYYKKSISEFMEGRCVTGVRYSDFISRMDLAYAAADVIISRSGASSVSEICACGKASVLVPSPNVAEDHQTHNAMALVSKGAALIVKDSEASLQLLRTAMELIHNEEKVRAIAASAGKMGMMNAAQTIIDEIYKLI